jgi:colanic acid biosynthesis glycosyl transferase WcaI
VLALLERGHRVTVITGRPSYEPASRSRWRLVTTEAILGVRVITVGSSAIPRTRMGGRVLNYLSFLLLATVTLCFVKADCVVVGSDPPFAVVGATLAARGRPVVYRLRDLHPDFAIAAGLLRNGLVAGVWDRVNRVAIRRCAFTVCVGAAMRDRVVAKGVQRERVLVIHDGAPEPDLTIDDVLVGELRSGAQFVAIHAGNLGFGVDWRSLAEAARLLPPEFRLIFIGAGAENELVRAAGCVVIPFVPREKLASAMHAGDVQIVGQLRGVEGAAVASKVFSVMAHSRPVLVTASPKSDPAQIVLAADAGLVAEPDDPTDIAQKLIQLSSDPEGLAQMGRNANTEWRKHFQQHDMAQKFALVVESCLSSF